MPMTSSSSGHATEQFTFVRRGYSPEEVTAHLARLEQESQSARQASSATAKELAALRAELEAARHETETARGEAANARSDAEASRSELDRQASQPLTMSSLSARMQRLLQIAEEESAEVRAAADRYRSETQAKTDAEAAALREAAVAEISKLRADTEADVAAMRADLAAEVERTQTEISEDRAELDQTRTAVYEQAKRLMTEAHADAERTLLEARERAEHMAATAAADRAKQEEDYELAIEARRRQAHRAIIEAEQTSRADAAHRIDQANTHARNIVESANAHAEDLLRRAASESHQRVAEADEAVRKLVSLRSELQQQILDLNGYLSDLTDTMATVRKTLEPLPLENQRPSADSFPADPGIKTTSTKAFESSPPQWHPPAPPVSLAWEKVSGQLPSGDEGGQIVDESAEAPVATDESADGLADAERAAAPEGPDAAEA